MHAPVIFLSQTHLHTCAPAHTHTRAGHGHDQGWKFEVPSGAGLSATGAGAGFSATGGETAVHGGNQKAVVEPPATLTGYAATGRETAVDTDVPLSGYTPGGAAQGNGKETVTGYEPTGAVPPDANRILQKNEVSLGGYKPTGGELPVEGQQHTPLQPK